MGLRIVGGTDYAIDSDVAEMLIEELRADDDKLLDPRSEKPAVKQLVREFVAEFRRKEQEERLAVVESVEDTDNICICPAELKPKLVKIILDHEIVPGMTVAELLRIYSEDDLKARDDIEAELRNARLFGNLMRLGIMPMRADEELELDTHIFYTVVQAKSTVKAIPKLKKYKAELNLLPIC